MKSFRALLACLWILGAGAALAQDDTLNWLGNYKEALKVAKETGKPIFLEFRCEA